MAMGSANIRLRPIKLGFLIDPREKSEVVRAVQLNSFLWGGAYNPIIPVYKAKPRNWERHPDKKLIARKITEGYIEAFDPDFLISLGKIQGKDAQYTNYKTISVEEIEKGINDTGGPGYGIGIYDLLKHLYQKEFKFSRADNLRITIPAFSRGYNLFLSAIFGSLPPDVDQIIKKNFDHPLGIQRPEISVRNYSDFLKPSFLFPRRVSQRDIQAVRSSSFHRGDCIFFMDASNVMDIIDYWNLRAIGWNIIPVARHICTADSVKELTCQFIEDCYWPYRYNKDFYNRATILKSRNTSEQAIKEFAQSLNIPLGKAKNEPKFLLQTWYPRIWDGWARNKDGVECCSLEAGELEHDLQSDSSTYFITTLSPTFGEKRGMFETPKFVNEVDLSFYGYEGGPKADVVPPSDPRLIHSFTSSDSDSWRISRRGLVHFPKYAREKIHLSSPLAEKVFMTWLKLQDFDVELSPAGRVAKQIMRHVNHLGILATPGIIDLLDSIAKKGRVRTPDSGSPNEDMSVIQGCMASEEVFARLQQQCNQQRFQPDPKRLLERLTKSNILKLGIVLQCPACQRRTWYSLDKLDYHVQCASCLHEFDVPIHSPSDFGWSYKTQGPFDIPDMANGAYSVLLTYHFFQDVIGGLGNKTTPLFSFTAKKGRINLEADLGLFYQSSRFDDKEIKLVFAECKSRNPFKKKDVERMKALASAFPDSTLVLSTLKEEFSSSEKRIILPLVNKNRRCWKSSNPFNPVVLLTATELYADMSLHNAWKSKGGRYQKFAEHRAYYPELEDLADITQQLYLNLPSRYELLDKK